MSEVVYVSKVRIERKIGPLRIAYLPGESQPVTFSVHGAIAHEKPDRRVVSQRLFDGGGDESTVGPQLLEEVGVIRQGPQDVGDEVAGGLIAGDE